LTSDFFRSLNRGANGSGFLPDRDGNTELMSPTSFVNVDTARRNVDGKTPFIFFNNSKGRKEKKRYVFASSSQQYRCEWYDLSSSHPDTPAG
jgi:hypothetical protein